MALEIQIGAVANIFQQVNLLNTLLAFTGGTAPPELMILQAMAALIVLGFLCGLVAIVLGYLSPEGAGPLKNAGTWLILGGLFALGFPIYLLAAGGSPSLAGGAIWSGVAAGVIGLLGGAGVCYMVKQQGKPSSEVEMA